MKAIDFIIDDVTRAAKMNRNSRAVFIFGTLLIPVLLGIGLREKIGDVFSIRLFIPNAIAAMSIAFTPLLFTRQPRRVNALLGFLCAIGLLLSIERIFFPVGVRTTYTTQTEFLNESELCFMKGAFEALAVGIWFVYFAFWRSSWPPLRWRIWLSVSVGISSSVMLGFHCDSSSVRHVLLGHIAPGLLLGGATYLVQRFIFTRTLRHRFSQIQNSIRHFERIG